MFPHNPDPRIAIFAKKKVDLDKQKKATGVVKSKAIEGN